MAVLIRWALALCLLALPTPAAAIFGGRELAADSSVAHAIVAILYRDDSGLGLCTGTLLGPTLVVTAAHCTAGNRADLRVVFAPTLENVPADRLRGVAAISRPDPPPDAASRKAFNNPGDIALIALDAPAPPDAGFARLTDDPVAGDYAIAGYGATSELAAPNADGKRQLGFDRVLRSATLALTLKDGVLVGDQSGGRGVCTGDSGGPAFRAEGDIIRVSGVLIGVSNSRSATDFCRGKAWYVPIARWGDWLVTAAKSLGVSLR